MLGLTFGMALARRGRIEAHRFNQTVWVLVNAALVLCIMIPSLRNAKPRSLADLATLSIGLPLLHAAIGVLTLALGLWLVLQMNDVLPQRWHTARWKTLMRLTLAGYWTGRYGETTGRDRAHAPFLAVVVLTVLVAIGGLLLHYMLGEDVSARHALLQTLIPTLALNLIIAAPVFALCRRILRPLDRPQRAQEVRLIV